MRTQGTPRAWDLIHLIPVAATGKFRHGRAANLRRHCEGHRSQLQTEVAKKVAGHYLPPHCREVCLGGNCGRRTSRIPVEIEHRPHLSNGQNMNGLNFKAACSASPGLTLTAWCEKYCFKAGPELPAMETCSKLARFRPHHLRSFRSTQMPIKNQNGNVLFLV